MAKIQRSAYIFLAAIATSIGVQRWGLIEPLELAWYDFAYKSDLRYQSPIVLVTVDESDIKNYGWSLNDLYLSRTINTIKSQSPIAIGLDIYRDVPVPPGTEELTQTFQTTNNLIGVEKVVDSDLDGKIAPPPILKQRGQVGTVDVPPDPDEKIRRGLLFAYADDDGNMPDLSLALAFQYLKTKNISPKPDADGWMILGKHKFLPFKQSDGGYAKVDDGGYQLILDYRTNFDRISLTRVLKNRDIPRNFFQDKIVMIGVTAPSLNDIHSTPKGRIAGVEVKAQMTAQIIDLALGKRNDLVILPDILEILIWLAIAIVFQCITYIYWQRCSLLLVFLILTLATSAATLALSYLALYLNIWLPVLPAILAILIISYFYPVADRFSRWKQEIENNRQQQNRFDNLLAEMESKLVAQQTLSQLGKIVATIVHEIKNPLDFISDLTELYLEELDRNNPNKLNIYEYLQSIQYHNARATQTIEYLSDFSRVSEPKKEEINFPELLEECLICWQEKFQSLKIKLSLNIEVETIYSDRQMLATIIKNLVTNSLCALEEQIQPTISIYAANGRDNMWEIEFLDNGVGIDSTDLPKIFDLFYSSNPKEGKGVGLWIVNEYIKALEGRIAVESKISSYTKFTILLPVGF